MYQISPPLSSSFSFSFPYSPKTLKFEDEKEDFWGIKQVISESKVKIEEQFGSLTWKGFNQLEIKGESFIFQSLLPFFEHFEDKKKF